MGAPELLHCTSWVPFLVCRSITENHGSTVECHVRNLLSTFALLHVGVFLLDSSGVITPVLGTGDLRNRYYTLCLEGCNCFME